MKFYPQPDKNITWKSLGKQLIIVLVAILAFLGVDFIWGHGKVEEIKKLTEESAAFEKEITDLEEEASALRQRVIEKESMSEEASKTISGDARDWEVFSSDLVDMYFRYPVDWGTEVTPGDPYNTVIEVYKGGYTLKITTDFYGKTVENTKPLASREVVVAGDTVWRRELGANLRAVEDQEGYRFETTGDLVSINYADDSLGYSFTREGVEYTMEYIFPTDEVGSDNFNEKISILDKIVGTVGFI